MKKIRILLSTAAIIIFTAMSASAIQHSGKSLQLWGDSAASLGRAGTGVASFGTDLFYLNPASIAPAERLGFGLQYGNLAGQYYNPDITIAVPTSYGTFGANFRSILVSDSEDFDSGYSLSIGGAKDFTSKIMIGMALNFFYGSSGSSLLYTGATIGTIYKFNDKSFSKGFGFFDPKAGLSVNFGLPLGDDSTYANFNQVTIGYSFKFYRNSSFNLGFFNDFSAINGYSDFPVKIGLESEIKDMIIVRAGTIVPQAYDYGDFTFGLGYKFGSETIDGSVNYTLAHYKDNNLVHYVGLNLEYGKLDREPPVTKVKPDRIYASPNHDGTNDYVTFKLGVEDQSRIKGWKLQVKDPDNKVVKEFTMSKRDTIEGLTFKGFFKRLVQKKESMVVPESIMWDGTDAKGNTVKDNKYTYAFNAWDERNNIAEARTGTVFIDNTSPEAKVSTDELRIFSPNGDKNKDDLIITQEIKTEEDDEWEAGFKDANGKVVKSYKWEGKDAPRQVVWNGKDEKNQDLPEGLYYYFIKSTDKAGNSASEEIKEITLTRKYEVADIRIANDYFSFKQNKSINLFPAISKKEGLDSWEIIITDDGGKNIRTIKGGNEMTPVVTWDCKDSEGKKLDDGEYFIQYKTVFKSGNRPESFKKKLIIDSTPPELEISHSPELFSPDKDEENDILTIKTESEEKFGIKEWKINIIAPAGNVFKSFSGTGKIPEEIKWDGLGENKDIVESAADYYLQLEATDSAGNTSVSKKDKVQIDILVIVTERGLKMRISNIEFKFDSAKILKKGTSILDRVYEILQKYEKYDVIIEGHTDNIGEDDYNLKLSEKRAKAVLDYLEDKGIEKKKMQFVGMGESVPLYNNDTKENRRRNRRVEFLLIKKN